LLFDDMMRWRSNRRLGKRPPKDEGRVRKSWQ
jgi:hypothetical protein